MCLGLCQHTDNKKNKESGIFEIRWWQLLDLSLQKEIEVKEDEDRLEIYTKTLCDKRCQLRKDMAQNIVQIDEGEEEESEVTQEAQAGMGGGGKKQEETRGQETDEDITEREKSWLHDSHQ